MLSEKPELKAGNLKDLRARLAESERMRKQKELSREELRTLWDAQLSETERALLRQLGRLQSIRIPGGHRLIVSEAVQWSEEHLFDRNSVVLECHVWQEALGRARGEDFSVSELTDFTRRRGYSLLSSRLR